MSKIKDLQTIEEFESLLKLTKDGNSKQPFFLLKHSTICPISSRAHQNVEAFMEINSTPVHRVLVIENRPLSNHIANFFSIPHQSPQIFLISGKHCLWNASHLAITETSMKERLEKVN